MLQETATLRQEQLLVAAGLVRVSKGKSGCEYDRELQRVRRGGHGFKGSV